jgi:hypothetical protein
VHAAIADAVIADEGIADAVHITDVLIGKMTASVTHDPISDDCVGDDPFIHDFLRCPLRG